MNRYTVRLTYIEVTKTPPRKQHAASFNLYKSQENSTYANNMLRRLTYTEVKNSPLRKQPAASFNLCKSQENYTYANNMLRHLTYIEVQKPPLRKQPAASLYKSQKKCVPNIPYIQRHRKIAE